MRVRDNDSRTLLDPHRRAVPQAATMARYRDDDEVDMLIVGCGAGGGVLAQRLARAGWRVVVLERGPFWDPDRDWVSDEAGAHPLYWTDKRIIGGGDPVELGKNNSGQGVGGSMIHFAGYTPRFHPSDFRTRTLDGVGADWPYGYEELRPHYERLEAELPVAGQHWPWGDPHGYPHSPHPISGAAERAWAGARAVGIEMRVGPVAIANGAFGNRPHCIYRGFCLQGCKVNAKASPLVTHVPDALAHGAEIRADSMAACVETDEAGRCTGVTYLRDGRERFQRAAAVSVAGYSIETPRLLLASAAGRFPHGLGNDADQVGRYVMVQGAPQVAGRFPELMRMYKAPPPEVSSEQFYETDAARGFTRGFSIQTVSPLPIGWAEHVLADGHWGTALREYMRDYNHWATLGALCELLPRAENRVTLADEVDGHGLRVARLDYTQGDNDRASIAHAKRVLHDLWEAAGAQDVLTIDRYAHLIGGCRMGTDPEDSVCDGDHRVWGVPNLFIADGSAMPTQGAANPALTIMAAASRLAERLAEKPAGAAPRAARDGGGRLAMTAAVPPIGEYAVIGDCHTAALVSRGGAIDWCCLPRFDSASAFGRLLDPAAGTCILEADRVDPGEPRVRAYLDGTLVLATTLRVPGGRARLYDCFAIDGDARRGNERRRLLRVVEGDRGVVPVRMLVQPRFDYGDVAPWIRRHGAGLYSAVGGDDGLLCWSDAGLAPDDDHGLRGRAVVRAGERVRLVLEFRRPETLDAEPVEAPSASAVDEQLDRAIGWWRAWSAGTAADGSDAAGVRRSALVLKALTYAATGAMVAAATTSLPETPDGRRTWDYRYSWIRDSEMASRSLVAVGHEAEADAFRRFIERSTAGSAADLQVFYGVGGERRLVEGEVGHLDGRPDGGPIRIGNAAAGQLQLDAYGHLVQQSRRWFERGHPPDDDYWEFLVELVDCAAERWSEPDRGIWEWRGDPRHFVHSKALCWAALDCGLRLAEQCGREAPEHRWRAARDGVRDAIEEHGFDPGRGTFVQAFGHPELDAALLRLPAVGFIDYGDPRMMGTVDAVREELDDDGLLRRYALEDGLPGREGAFLACTFWLVECLAGQGRVQEARAAFDRAMATANDVGLFAEQFAPSAGMMLGNFPQALTHLSHVEAAMALAHSAAEVGPA